MQAKYKALQIDLKQSSTNCKMHAIDKLWRDKGVPIGPSWVLLCLSMVFLRESGLLNHNNHL